MDGDLTLVLGGTGKTGRRVAARLWERDVPTRLGSRTGEPPFDWADRATWAPALDGVRAVYVSYFPDLAVPGARDAVAELAERAVTAGVRRLVLLSGRGEDEARRAEAALAGAGAEWTVVRASWFAQNFDEGYLLEPVIDGGVALPVGDVREPFVDADDVADVAVAALTGDGHAGRVYEVTGPRALTFAEALDEIGRACGRTLRFERIPMEAYGVAMAEAGEPPELIALMRYLFAEVLDGRNAAPADGVRRALGREARDFRDYAREAAATGAWSAPAAVRR
jgi:uncharacterized protein YbjT (DUF2867 family)